MADGLDLTSLIRDIPDFPKPGVGFKDITPLLGDAAGFAHVVDRLTEHFTGRRVDKVVGIEARGFVIAAPIAHRLGAGLVPIRKPGKLPWTTQVQEYDLEHGGGRRGADRGDRRRGRRARLRDRAGVPRRRRPPRGARPRVAPHLRVAVGGRPLVVVAVRQEAAHLTGVDVLLTGIGKVAAAASVARAVAERRPSRVLNVGTAGALREGVEGIHRIGRVIEHDVDHAALSALIGEPVPGEVLLDADLPMVLATGDAFVQGGPERLRLAERAHLVDMEGYAVAVACAAAGVPCELVKVVSDAADETAGHTWLEQVDMLARVIADVVAQELT
jgi:adenosylhomocysteine nucleosidase